jgi:Uma2 family endonuclease
VPQATDHPTRGPWTYERLCAETEEDTVRREIIDGWLFIDGQPVDDPHAEVVAESSGLYHGATVMALIIALHAATEELDGQLVTAPMDVAFGDRILQPDVFWVPGHLPRDTRPIRTCPALVVEVSSRSTRRHDLVRKRRVYEQAGVPEYWFVDLDAQRIEVYLLPEGADTYPDPRLHGRGRVVTSSVLEGFAVEVDDILGPPEEIA